MKKILMIRGAPTQRPVLPPHAIGWKWNWDNIRTHAFYESHIDDMQFWNAVEDFINPPAFDDDTIACLVEILDEHLPRESRETDKSASATSDGPRSTDLKAGLGNIKPPVGYTTKGFDVYAGRASQYGGEKYGVAGNYLRPAPDGDDLERLFQYACAARRHLSELCMSIVRFKAGGIGAAESINAAAYAKDCKDGPISSNLPSLCGVAASVNIMIQQAIDAGLIPEDPGITWDREALVAWRKEKGL